MEIRSAFKERLRIGKEVLYRAFEQGMPVRVLVQRLSALIDSILGDAWRLYLDEDPRAALVAVGGYGRSELHPASDVDLLILIEDAVQDELTAALEQFITLLWDIGLAVGHSVRTVADCVRAAGSDIQFMTSLLDARHLAGSQVLFARMQAATGPDRIWDSARFFAAKLEEQRARWQKYGDTAYNLEPNIKENPGGLRDIQMIGWVTRRHFGAKDLHELVAQGFLTASEHQTLIGGETLLWRIRFALHRLAGRHEDRLLFDYQRTLALQFGFRDGDNNLAVEQFMQQYYRTVQELNQLNEMLLQLFAEAILLPDDQPPVPINRRFQARNGYLEVISPEVFRRTPLALLEACHLLQLHPELKGIRASTIRLIRENRHRIDDVFRADIRARSLFMEILREPQGLTRAMLAMNRYGVLAAYIPAFANIVGRMQYDLFHVYTVDEHTLMLLRNLRRFVLPEYGEEFPLCTAVAKHIPKLELLYLAGLFHDIAKGRGGDHSLLGAEEALAFCWLHGLSDYDSALVAWLVEHHLVMSMTAQRKDISDPEVIQSFAALVGDPVRLDYLYLLTVADARATNPARWNSWLDALLRELYYNARRALLRGLDHPEAQEELIAQKQDEGRRLLLRHGIDLESCHRLWQRFNRDFFLYNSPDEIAWQTQRILKADSDAPFLVEVRALTPRGSSEILIYAKDRDHLFAQTTAALDQMGLNIMDARIMTTADSWVVNSYHVLEHEGITLSTQRLEEVRGTLRDLLADPSSRQIQVSRALSRRHRHFPVQTQVDFALDLPNQRTIMRLTTRDRPGLLAEVGAIFEHCGIRLQNAKITTIGAEVDDVFFITTREDTPVTCEQVLECVRHAIHERLEVA
ncbi:[protein-PII] uridylyltransferase [Caldichromatium japonicum]|uniref:Bifunctional uridylyltransferase/uridylyl-removing enzyme n=1 Tax=Caldichromatium japonicum TaxID=2699430 RepID=A0A6G7VBB9_9GAMM|nr:[protein-PII] uridylyltransferase [Caldichromatium japonicum]QIK37311.1 [protein-PII] uridylyltransferase [Caldichromatium japonicum]